MTELTSMPCADCGAVFQFTPNPNFPRKYCDNCSRVRKERWKAKQGQTTIPTQISQPQALKREYHLTEEQIKSNALSSAIAFNSNNGISVEAIIKLAQVFEAYIRGA